MGAAAPSRSKATTQQRAARNARALERARNGHTSAKTATRPAPAAPRRKSGPAAPRKAAPARAPRKVAPRTAAQQPKVARIAQGSAALLLDRLLRGRAWVVLMGALLAGIVFLNVSVLELNRGIARTDAQAASLERANSLLRSRVAGLDNAERVQRLAEARGFILPQPGDVTYLHPGGVADAKLAAARIVPPSSSQQTAAAAAQPAGSSTASAATSSTASTTPSTTSTNSSSAAAPPAATTTAPPTASAPSTTSTTTVP